MNLVTLVGFVAIMSELVTSANGTTFVRFRVSVRNTSSQNATSFVDCVAFGKTAEFLSKYFVTGSPIGIEAEVRNNNYPAKNGNMQYTYNFVVKQVHFVGKKESNPAVAMKAQAAPATAPVAPGALPFPPAPPATAPAASGGLPLPPAPPAAAPAASGALPFPPAPPAAAPAASGALPFPPAPSKQPVPPAAPPMQPMPADTDGLGQGLKLGKLEDVFTADEMTFGTAAEAR